MILVFFLLGLVLLIVGAELLVRGATRLAVGFGITPLVVGLTVVAFGTSAPELAITIQSSLAGQGDLAIGNVVGSNITNVLLILGLAAVITPLTVAQKLIRLDVPLMIGVSFLMLLLGLDMRYGLLDGALLVLGIIAYTVFAIVQSRRESKQIESEYAEEYAQPRRPTSARRLRDLVLIAVGLILLTIGSRWMVDGAVSFARSAGISELVIGLTVVASMRGERDIAVGNVVGSSIFNILSVLGVGALVAPGGIAVSATALAFDIPVMIAVAIACLPIFLNGHTIYRWEGALFLCSYAAYTTYLVLTATRSEALPVFRLAMLAFVLPLIVITLLVGLARAPRKRQH
jgi:cation:H+ antiporter